MRQEIGGGRDGERGRGMVRGTEIEGRYILRFGAAGLLFLLDHTVLFKVIHTVVQRELLSIGPDCLLLFLWEYVWTSILLAFKTDGADPVLSVNARKALTSLVSDGIICSTRLPSDERVDGCDSGCQMCLLQLPNKSCTL